VREERSVGLSGVGLCTVLALSVLGCARYQRVHIRSEPAGAAVFLDGVRIGETPLQHRIDRDADHLVFLKLDGYVPVREVLTLNRAPDRIDFLTPADVDLRLGRDFSAPGDTSREVEVAPGASDSGSEPDAP